jgi:hypothetical protein
MNGNGGESNGAGGMRRFGGEAFGAGASNADDCKSCTKASNNRCLNQSGLSAAPAFEIRIPARSPTFVKLN